MTSFEMRDPSKPGEGLGMRREHAPSQPVTARPYDTSLHDPLGAAAKPHITSETAARDTLEQFGSRQPPDTLEPQSPLSGLVKALDDMKAPVPEILGDGSAKVVDQLGRVLIVRRLKLLTRTQLMELLGPDLAKNEPYMGHATVAAGVQSIDGEPMIFTNKMGLDAIFARLDDEGMLAATMAYAALGRSTVNVRAAAKN